MNKKTLIVASCIITVSVIIAAQHFFGLYHMPIGCNSIEFTVGCALVNEIGEMKWVKLDALAEELCCYPQRFSAWFITAFPMVYRYIREVEVCG